MLHLAVYKHFLSAKSAIYTLESRHRYASVLCLERDSGKGVQGERNQTVRYPCSLLAYTYTHTNTPYTACLSFTQSLIHTSIPQPRTHSFICLPIHSTTKCSLTSYSPSCPSFRPLSLLPPPMDLPSSTRDLLSMLSGQLILPDHGPT